MNQEYMNRARIFEKCVATALLCVPSLLLTVDASWASPTESSLLIEESTPSFSEENFIDTPPCCATATAQLVYSDIEIEYAVGRAVGIDRNYGTLGLFLASCSCDQWVQFLDIKAHSINNGKWGTNLGIGVRYVDPVCFRDWGANIFYDFRSSQFKGFHQLGIGLESLGASWDFRINGYFPLGDTEHHGRTTVFDQYNGDYVVTCQPHIFALTGFDGEVGSSIWECDCVNVYLAGGPYYFAKNKFENSWGGKGRLNFQCGNFFSCELKVSHDSIYNTAVQAIFKIELPFDIFNCKIRPSSCCTSSWNSRCLESVQRNDLIVLDGMRCWTKNY